MPWNKSLKSATLEIRKGVQKDVRVIANYGRDQMQSRTPVGNPTLWKRPPQKGYVGGTLRRSWELERRGESWFIFSAQPYAERVWAEGWSSQLQEGAVDVLLNDLRNVNV